ncbi:hypothetical protein H2509_09865, partial [Stappia sp. F7233]
MVTLKVRRNLLRSQLTGSLHRLSATKLPFEIRNRPVTLAPGHPKMPRKKSAAHVSLSSIFTCQRTEVALKPLTQQLPQSGPKPADNQSTPLSRGRPTASRFQVVPTAKGAVKSAAPPSLLALYTQHQSNLSTTTPKKTTQHPKTYQTYQHNTEDNIPRNKKYTNEIN